MGKSDILGSLGSMELLIGTVVFIASYVLMQLYRKQKIHLPPGPLGYPIIGCLSYINKDPHLRLQEMAEKHGDVFSMYLGNRLVVVLNGVDAIKEGMNKPEFLGRPPQGPFDLVKDFPNVATISGKEFHEQRKFMMHSMRDLGFGKTVMEECMKEELDYFLRAVADTKGKPFEVTTLLNPSTSNNITALVFGTRYDYNDPRRKLLDDTRALGLEFIGQTAIHAFLPWVSKIPFIKHYFGYHTAIENFFIAVDFNRKQIVEHKKTLDPNHTRDFIDKYLLEMQQIREKGLADTSFTEKMLVGNIGALMGAGSETVHTTLKWCLFLMAVYQDVQKKVQDEISTIVGSERTPEFSDQREMPYTQSVIMEIMRWKTIIPLNLLRYTFQDTTFRGYDIPNDTIILANLWSAHYDRRYWEEPEKFLPERFLSVDGQSVVKSEAYMPFSVGRRACPGETMAVVEVFIYFTTILQRFDIKLPHGVTPDLEGLINISLNPKPHKLCFISRSSN